MPAPAGEQHIHFHEPIYGIDDFREAVMELLDELARSATGWVIGG